MDRYVGPQTAVIIALLVGLYLAILMDRYGGTYTHFTISLLGGL
jgi:F0F1-type ATP synthase assembly protein I